MHNVFIILGSMNHSEVFKDRLHCEKLGTETRPNSTSEVIQAQQTNAACVIPAKTSPATFCVIRGLSVNDCQLSSDAVLDLLNDLGQNHMESSAKSRSNGTHHS